MDCFQFNLVPFAFCSSIFVTSTSDIVLGGAGTGAGACLTATSPCWRLSATLVVVLTPLEDVGAAPVGLAGAEAVVFGLGAVAAGLRGMDPTVPEVPVAAGFSSSFSLRSPSFSRILPNRLMGNPFTY